MARKVLYFDRICGTDIYACVEDGRLTEFNTEPSDDGSIIGNIYKGRVTDVLNGMQAAFVDCGLERHCYISIEDMSREREKYESREIDIPARLDFHVGDEIMVQVTKAPVGKKGAKVTAAISFVGKYTVYLPETPFLGVSLKIADAELRKNLLFGADRARKENEGLIVRTAAPYATRPDKLNEINYFRKLYQSIKSKFKNASVGELLYSDYPLHRRVLRDNVLIGIERIHAGNPELGADITEALKLYPSRLKIPVTVHDGNRDMLYTEGLREQINETLSPRIELENGAYIVLERTEALTVIDVNTGKFTGDDSLEHTVYYTNILAAREIARQVKLRNLGGIFVVDFIDVNDSNHRKSIVAELEKALKKDKARCKVLPMSDFGLVEFTRRRMGLSPFGAMTEPCNRCGGAGYTRTPDAIIFDLRAKLLELLHEGNKAVFIDMNFDVAMRLYGRQEMRAEIAKHYPQARVYLVPHRTYGEETLYFRSDNSPVLTLPEGYLLLY